MSPHDFRARFGSVRIDSDGARPVSRAAHLRIAAALLVALWANGGTRAMASLLYAVNNDSLVTIDIATQAVNTVGSLGVDSMQDAAFDGSGHLAAVRRVPFTADETYSVNTGTGAASLLNGTLQGSFLSLAWNAADSQFYSVSLNTGFLGTLDVNSGAFSSPYSSPHNLRFRVDGLAFSPTGTLYGMYNSNPTSGIIAPAYQLVRFDLTTGLSTAIGNVADGINFRSLCIDGSGNAYTVASESGDVYQVDLATGVGADLFNSGVFGVTGLATQVPEPATLGLLGLALGLRHVRSLLRR